MKITVKSPLIHRARQKLLEFGTAHLSDTELLTLLIGSGSDPDQTARQLLRRVDYDLKQLARLSVGDLRKLEGIGETRAINLVSAIELGRRRDVCTSADRPGIQSSGDAYALIRRDLQDLSHEEFWILLLNRNHRLILKQQISKGGISGTVVDPRIIFKTAVDHLASAVIVAHNHPSEHLKPSQSDLQLTQKLVKAGRLLEIPLLDHLILNSERYLSFADEQML
ncbi:RadC family protein [Fulvivirga sedimenti]|uniref:DNA repair protein RadC n=1 Tax=Fulvivirga sedimenti TaxID=2879465 RepID=A0A9X1HU08_9BACT|nr:DNA repair protein RadC [Fulvivirga sedimenti]MCA6077931.1 DNA repair protein RadC [Fulvivirga sedimenti]